MNSAKKSTPVTEINSRPANIRGTSLRKLASSIREARPVSLPAEPATNSAATEPIKAGLLKPDPPTAWRRFQQLCDRRPVMLIRGALSDIVSDDIAAKMQAKAPSLTVAEVPDVGHAPLLNEPAALDALARFLERVPVE